LPNRWVCLILATRSLDLLHLAAALLLNATAFFSFDDRYRQVARLQGMTIKPA
jgi:predicted nucleic acid-binding protein